MPFPVALSGGQYTTLRASGYWQRTIAVLNPSDVVFRAQSSEAIADAPFITFTWDNADVGAYTDVLEGMVCYLSATTSIRDAFYRGRVRLAPSSNEFYIDENASILSDGTYIIVTRDADLFARVRRDTLVDGSIAYHNLPPMIAGLPSVLCLYDADNDGVVSYAAVQTGVAVASGATISSWLHTISGAGAVTFISGTSTSQNPTIQFEAGYHYLWRVRVTDSNGVQMFQFVQVYAVDRAFSAPANTSLVTGSISTDLEAGYTASITAYADVSTLIDRTHCAVFSIEHFGDNTSTPIVTNILMNGRIRSDSIQTQGTEEAGQVQQVTFAVEGITSYLQRLRLPNDIVRAAAVPDEWGEMVNPNPFRMAVYAMWVYTTLPNICSFSAETGNFDAWRIGAEPTSIDGGFATDVLNTILWERIKAQPNYAPSGEIFLARNVNYLTDRSGVVTVADLALQDMRDYTVDRDSSRVTAQVIAYGGVYESATNRIVLYTAQSPSIVYGDAPETRELTRELLEYDSTVTEATTELAGRASNDYAFQNPKPLLNLVLYDSWAWLIPTNYRRYTATIPAGSNTLGIPYTTADYWQCQSAALTINADGSIDVSAEFSGETEFSDAQAVAALLPNNLENLNPVLPVLPNDPAFPTDPLELYPNDAPGIDDLQPIDNYSLGQTQTPLPPDIASDMSTNQGKPGCQVMAVNFRNPNNTTSPKLTVLSADYLMTLEGFAALGESVPSGTYDTESSYAQLISGSWVADTPMRFARAPGLGSLSEFDIVFPQPVELVQFTYQSQSLTVIGFTPNNGSCELWLGGVLIATVFSFSRPNDGEYVWQVANTAVINSVVGAGTVFDTMKFKHTHVNGIADVRGEVVVTAGSALPVSGDAFYRYYPDDPEASAQLYADVEGLRIDNAAIDPSNIPPFNPNHNYQIVFEGTGNVILARMELVTRDDVQNRNLSITVCRVT